MTQRANSILAASNKINIPSKRTSLNGNLQSYSPTANIASFFNTNFDENGYVFDGVKIDVNTGVCKSIC